MELWKKFLKNQDKHELKAPLEKTFCHDIAHLNLMY